MIPLLLPFCFPTCALPSGFAVFVRDAGDGGTVRMCAVDSPQYTTDPLLTGIRLLDCAPAGRTPLDESFPARALLRSDLEQGTRVELPYGHGSIYHYQRADGASSRYGFFSIDAQGAAHVLIELPAAPGPSDPFLESVACSSNGARLLVATQPGAGGDLWELRVDGSAALDRTANLAAQVFGRDSFFLSPDLGTAVTTSGVLRFDPQSNDCAEWVGFGSEPVPPWLGLELVPSANGQFVAFVAGDSQALARPFVLGSCEDAQCMNTLPGFLSGAGCLPEASNGPWLAVSNDGTLCAWRSGESHTSGYAHELYLARRAMGGQTLALHVTQDALFEPYIDEIGLAFFRPGGQLVFAAGDPGTNQALVSRADLFSAALDSSGALQLSNLSVTSGNAAPPFLYYGTLELFGLRVRPYSGEALLYSRDASGNRLVAVDPGAPGTLVVQDGVEALGPLDASGDEWILGLHVPGTEQQTGLWRFENECAPELELVLGLPSLGGASRVVRSASDHQRYACVSADGPLERLWQVDVSDGSAREFSRRDLSFGRSLAWTSDDALILSLHLCSGESFFVVWPQGASSHKLWLLPQRGFVLPA